MVLGCGLKCGFITEELPHAAHQIETSGHRRQQRVTVLVAKQSAGWCHAVDEGSLRPVQQGQGLCQVRHDGDAVGNPIEHESGIETGAMAVNDSANVVPVAMTNKTVGRLAIESGEVAFAVDKC